MADSFRLALQAQVAVIRGEAGQGVDLPHTRIALSIQPYIGAGDVKFFGVVGAILGVSWLPRVFFYSALVAGVIAIFYLASGLASFSRMKSFWLDIRTAILSMGTVLPDPVYVRTRGTSVPWGVAFAGGTIIAYYFDPDGRWAGF